MCVKFQLSVSESSRDIKVIVLPAGSVHLRTRAWQFDPDSASQRQFQGRPVNVKHEARCVMSKVGGRQKTQTGGILKNIT